MTDSPASRADAKWIRRFLAAGEGVPHEEAKARVLNELAR